MNLKIKLNIFFTCIHLIIKAFNDIDKLDHDLWKESNSSNHYEYNKNSLRFIDWKKVPIPDCC